MRYTCAALAAAFSLAGLPAAAQTQAQFDRINSVAEHAIYLGACERFGYTSSPNASDAILADLIAELTAEGLPAAETERLGNQAVARHASRLKADLESSLAAARNSPNLPAKAVQIFTALGQGCARASQDTIVGKYMTAPAGYDLKAKVVEITDGLLEDGGLASWQTPRIQARGDLVSVAGACRQRIGAARSDALFNQYSRTDDPRERDYYARSFQRGIDDPELTALDSVQCERVVTSFTKKAGPPPK